MEGLTEEQKAFRIRKLKTRFCTLDVNRNGYVTVEDYDELAKRFIEYGKLTGDQVTRLKKAVQDLCYVIGFRPGVKINLELFIQLMTTTEEKDTRPEATREAVKNYFDAVDTDADGVISLKEFEVYFDAIGVGKKHAKASFVAIDADHDGKISRNEFMGIAIEFINNTDPAHPSTLFFGPLVD